MGRKPVVDWSTIKKYEVFNFYSFQYREYRRLYLSALRTGRNPKTCKINRRYVLTLDCDTITGQTKHAQYVRKVKEGNI
jgi:hypothetical protein